MAMTKTNRPEWGTLKYLETDEPIRSATKLEWKRSVRADDRQHGSGIHVDGIDAVVYVDGGTHCESECRDTASE